MKNPLPLLLTLAVGGLLMSRTSKRSNPASEDEIPLSMDYENPELHALLDEQDEQDEQDEDEDQEEGDDDELAD